MSHSWRRQRRARLLLLLLLAVSLAGCQGRPAAAPANAVGAPTGELTAVVAPDYQTTDPTRRGTLVITIQRTATGEVLHRMATLAAARLTWAVDWPAATTVRLRASDTGTFCWQVTAAELQPVTCP